MLVCGYILANDQSMNSVNRYEQLASKWLEGTITEKEKAEFSQWYNNHADENLRIPDSFAKDESELRDRILQKVRQEIYKDTSATKRRYPFQRIAVAASLALFLLSAIAYFLPIPNHQVQSEVVELDNIQPGGNKAILTFADGRIIDLDEQKSGLLIGDQIQYIDGSEVVPGYDDSEAAVSYVTISTPKGGQYQVNLPDGTIVWLNSVSSVRFPQRFDSTYREVELLTGEAYFEVSKQVINGKKTPFYVKNGQQLVQVLGTQFNINTYDRQAGIVTTVVEGSVAVQPYGSDRYVHKSRKVLTSGDQSVIKGQDVKVQQVDPELFTSWKHGYFYFNDADIYTVMKDFERWYDIKVKYEIPKSDDLFVGKIPRNISLGEALNVLKITGVQYQWSDNGKLVITKKQ